MSPMGSSSRLHAVIAAILASALVLGGTVAIAPHARAGAAIIFSDGFETGGLSPRWVTNDSNPASGIDDWGVSTYRPHSGNYSAWCAQVGNQSAGPYMGQNNSAVHEYDDNMQADFSLNLSVNGYSSLFLSFYYWVRTENGGGDWLQAAYVAGGVTTILFQQGGSSGNAWQPANVSVPTNIEQLIFRFHTDAANHGFEGAYVDDLVLTGIENVPPTSSVSSLPQYTNQDPYGIPYTAADNANASGVAYVQLWYRTSTTGAFTEYTTVQNPQGRWTSPTIPFDAQSAAGDGYYEFYTVAVDHAGNSEAAPAAPDANVTVDTVAPAVTINEPAGGALLNTSTVTVSWQASDAVSGVSGYAATVDGGAFAPTSGGGLTSFTGLEDGMHVVTVQATDYAGNVAQRNLTFTVDTNGPVLTITDPTAGVYLHSDGYTFQWISYDNTTGVDHYMAWLDDRTPVTIADTSLAIPAISEGAHTFHVEAVDRAGNVASASVHFRVDRNPFSLTGPYDGIPLFVLLGLILLFLLILLILWRRRKEDEKERSSLEADGRASAETASAGQEAPDPTPKDPGGT
ncbi:MAG TPA: LPXTG cell wall anchor domain-containing protein [Thermoplasmata archaeon]|nr:LPXTG cell wall anchor domain-containing protein [Thermoplasmata archaeon]